MKTWMTIYFNAELKAYGAAEEMSAFRERDSRRSETQTPALHPFFNLNHKRPPEVRFSSWAEPDSYWCAEDGLNDGRVELYEQLLWQVELPQLAMEIQWCSLVFCSECTVIFSFPASYSPIPEHPLISTIKLA